jgi:hypothetical protein
MCTYNDHTFDSIAYSIKCIFFFSELDIEKDYTAVQDTELKIETIRVATTVIYV